MKITVKIPGKRHEIIYGFEEVLSNPGIYSILDSSDRLLTYRCEKGYNTLLIYNGVLTEPNHGSWKHGSFIKLEEDIHIEFKKAEK